MGTPIFLRIELYFLTMKHQMRDSQIPTVNSYNVHGPICIVWIKWNTICFGFSYNFHYSDTKHLGYIWGVFEVYWGVFEVYLRCIWGLFEVYLRCIWGIYSIKSVRLFNPSLYGDSYWSRWFNSIDLWHLMNT